MNNRKRLAVFLGLMACLAGSILPVQAGAVEKGQREEQRVVFVNEQNGTPDLYVSKQVEGMGESREFPEDLVFDFILKLDGELAERRPYRVFDADGGECFDSAGGIPIPFRTDRFGGFALKAGQTARFAYVGTGVSYEVTELPKEGWEQTSPAGGMPAVGTVTDKGAWARFVNLTGGGEDTALAVRKILVFPEDCVPLESPDFWFSIKLGGKPYGQESYTITGLADGRVLGTGSTDRDGNFKLKGGQEARFSNVPVQTDYEVTEKSLPEGWRTVGSDRKEGTTGAGGTIPVIFCNTNASFAVTKRMEDGSRPDKEFSFLLIRGDGSLWRGAEYERYEPGEESVSGKTDGEGRFVLKPGQTAVFTGIEPGTIYQVSEEEEPEYPQLVPGRGEGYVGREVTDAVELLPFVNGRQEGGFTVTKRLDYRTGDAPIQRKSFAFCLSRETEDGYRELANAVYEMGAGTNQETYATDEQGLFFLKANETARFTELPEGNYRVEELLDFGPEYTQEESVQYGSITAQKPEVNLVFTNGYYSRFFDLHLYKKSDSGEPLAGAEFMLYRQGQRNNPVGETSYTTSEQGEAVIEGLKPGSYELVETKAPDGYELLANPIQVEAAWEEDELKLWIDGEEKGKEGENGVDITQGTEDRDQAEVTIYNSRRFTLPVAGGSGDVCFLAAGGAGMAGILVKKKKGNERKKVIQKGEKG